MGSPSLHHNHLLSPKPLTSPPQPFSRYLSSVFLSTISTPLVTTATITTVEGEVPISFSRSTMMVVVCGGWWLCVRLSISLSWSTTMMTAVDIEVSNLIFLFDGDNGGWGCPSRFLSRQQQWRRWRRLRLRLWWWQCLWEMERTERDEIISFFLVLFIFVDMEWTG